jgi:predicted transcriptional regulator
MEIRLSDDELEALNRLCLVEDRTASFILRKALAEYLNSARVYGSGGAADAHDAI